MMMMIMKPTTDEEKAAYRQGYAAGYRSGVRRGKAGKVAKKAGSETLYRAVKALSKSLHTLDPNRGQRELWQELEAIKEEFTPTESQVKAKLKRGRRVRVYQKSAPPKVGVLVQFVRYCETSTNQVWKVLFDTGLCEVEVSCHNVVKDVQ